MLYFISSLESKTDGTAKESPPCRESRQHGCEVTLGRHMVSILERQTEAGHGHGVFQALDSTSAEIYLAKEEMTLRRFGRITECRKTFPKRDLF